MRLARSLCLMAFGVLAVLPSVGHAQPGPIPRVRQAIEETDRHIQQAETVVAASDDAQARSELERARELQALARSAQGNERLLVAGRFTLEARGHADRAIQLVRGLPDEDRVLGQLERTRELLDRAGERIRECGDDRGRALLRVALEMQVRAENARRAERPLGALQLTMGARERGQQALRLCRMEEDVQETADRALRQTDQVLSRSRAMLETGAAGRPLPAQARDAFARAAGMQDEASRQFRDGRYESSLQLTLTARRIAHRAVRGGAPGF